MWSGTNSQAEPIWKYDLTGPFNTLSSLHYRYCRDGQCGSADDAETTGINPTGRVVNPSSNPGTLSDEITHWAWYSGQIPPASVPDVQVTPRSSDFVAGVAFQPRYQPSWGPLLTNAINGVQSLDANWLVLLPTWTFTNENPPILEPLPSQDMLWPELASSITSAHDGNLNVALFPTPHFPIQVDQWWQDAPLDFPWWVSFFERYTNFILHHATAASTDECKCLDFGWSLVISCTTRWAAFRWFPEQRSPGCRSALAGIDQQDTGAIQWHDYLGLLLSRWGKKSASFPGCSRPGLHPLVRSTGDGAQCFTGSDASSSRHTPRPGPPALPTGAGKAGDPRHLLPFHRSRQHGLYCSPRRRLSGLRPPHPTQPRHPRADLEPAGPGQCLQCRPVCHQRAQLDLRLRLHGLLSPHRLAG